MKWLVFIYLFIAGFVIVLPSCKKHNEVLPVAVIADSLFYTSNEASLIFSNDSTQAFTILSASNSADSAILKKTSRNVKTNNDTTNFIISRMYRTISNYTGNIDGITAPEIGINRNIIIVKRKDKVGNPFEVFINPKITEHSNAFTTYQENCLTMPGEFPTSMDRYNLVFVEYYSANGTHHSELIEQETAAFVQHEVAHLTGGILTISYDPLAFTGQEIDSIMADTIAMRIYKTTNFQDSLVLRKTSIDVRPDASNPVLIRVINRMRKALAASSGGVGIAAPQIGINRNIILVKRQDKIGTPVEVYLNPKIVMTSDSIINFVGDGCLSIPGVSKTTRRYTAVGIEYDLLNGTHKSEVIFGYSGAKFTAVIFQHEIDHLNGILFIDRAI
jgi:peptide deformylase